MIGHLQRIFGRHFRIDARFLAAGWLKGESPGHNFGNPRVSTAFSRAASKSYNKQRYWPRNTPSTSSTRPKAALSSYVHKTLRLNYSQRLAKATIFRFHLWPRQRLRPRTSGIRANINKNLLQLLLLDVSNYYAPTRYHRLDQGSYWSLLLTLIRNQTMWERAYPWRSPVTPLFQPVIENLPHPPL